MMNKNNFSPKNHPYKKNKNWNDNKESHAADSNELFYYLPRDTETIIKNKINIIDNYSLKLNKVSPFDVKENKFVFFKTDKRKNVIVDVSPNFPERIFSDILSRQKALFDESGLSLKQNTYNVEWKLAIGLGNESVYETSITLHHIYGIPYIPGSALKGIVRSHIILERFGKNEQNVVDLKSAEKRALNNKEFCDIFGCPKESFYKESRQGNIIFFDAFPKSKPKIQAEIMNPHFGPYYSDKSYTVPPADYLDPKPVFFLIVKNTEFTFTVGIKNESKEDGLLSIADEWMKKALTEHGIGAKTAVGYGYFV